MLMGRAMAFLDYQPRSTLFHYCSAAGFDGICATGSIWLTDLQHANDPKELQLATVIQQVMSELESDPKVPPVLRSVYRQLQSRLERLRSRFGMYSSSFSLNGDQLPMWQEYTDRGRGYCIGFRATAFNHMPLRIQRVVYANPSYFEAIHPQIEAIAAPLAGHHNDFLKEIEPITSILSLITSVKDDTWAHECEVRLIFSSMAKPADFDGEPMMPVSELRDGTPVFPADPAVRERAGVQVPYFSKPFGRMRGSQWDPSFAISHVLIGPNNQKSADEVAEGLHAKGYRGFEVARSRCAFRP